MTVLTVIAAPDRRFDAVRETLEDWSAAGLVGDHCWAVHADPGRDVLRSTATGTTGVSLAAVASTERYERVRLVHLATLGDPALDRVFADEVEREFGAARVTRIRALFAASDEQVRVTRAAQGGWHTLLIAPEDGAGPDHSGVEIRDSDSGAATIAATLAGLTGLWSGHERSPFDGTQAPGDATVRLVRSYLRRLDAADAEAGLRRRVLESSDRLPLPVHAGTPAARIEDVALACRTMAQQLWQQHSGMLRGPRDQVRSAPAKRIGAADAMQLFLSFLWAALRNAPRRWLQSTVHAVKARTAAVVQDVVYGAADSAYSVVVGGVTADGRPASWLERRDVSERLAKALEHRVPVQHHAPDDPAAVWQDYVAGALTLADAGERVAALPPATIGTRRGVVNGPEDVVPGPEERFTDVSPAVTASIGPAGVDAYDLLGGVELRDRLRAAAVESSIGMPAAEAAHRLEVWRDRHTSSYAVQVGGGVAQALVGLHEEVQVILDRLRRAAERGDSSSTLQRQQRRLARVLQLLTGVAAIILAIVAVLLAVGAVGVVGALVAGAGVVVVWAVTGFLTFVQGQRTLFALLNERAQLLSQVEVDERNLVLALRDVRRVSDLYEQFLVWSRVLGVFLRGPLGRDDGVGDRVAADLQGLPLSVAAAVAVPGDDRLGRVAAELRREVFGTGWLSGPWAALLADAPALLGPRGVELGDRPEAVFHQRGDADGLLIPWERALAARGVPAAAGEAVWERAAQVLASPDRTAVRAQVVGRVRTADGVEESEAEFLADSEPGAARSGRFGDALLSPAALTARRAAIEEGRVDEVRRGLGVDRVLVQLSAPIPEWELAGWTEESKRWWEQDQADPSLVQRSPFHGEAF